MKWVTIKRIVRTGLLDFWRNGFISSSSILMMVNTLFVIGLVMFSGILLNATLQEMRAKINMSVTFVTDANQSDIDALTKAVEGLPEVASVSYMSGDEVLANFREEYQNDQLTLQSVDELDHNPFGGRLTIQAKDTSQYETIAAFIKQQNDATPAATPFIDKINYYDDRYQVAVNRLTSIIDSARLIGMVIIIIFVINTIANSFMTLRLAIHSSREEIQVMRLVGAAKGYIRSPFIVEGILYGLIAGIVTLLLFYPLTWWLGHATESFFGSINVFNYYLSEFPLFFLVIVGSGVILGATASYLAVRRYLKV